MPGETVTDQLNAIVNTAVVAAPATAQDVALALLGDQQQAFDMLGTQYLMVVVSSWSFPVWLTGVMHSMYSQRSAVMSSQGHLGPRRAISRGMAMGVPSIPDCCGSGYGPVASTVAAGLRVVASTYVGGTGLMVTALNMATHHCHALWFRFVGGRHRPSGPVSALCVCARWRQVSYHGVALQTCRGCGAGGVPRGGIDQRNSPRMSVPG